MRFLQRSLVDSLLMRAIFLVACMELIGVNAEGAEFWSTPMCEVDAESADQTLLVVLITDDVGSEWATMGQRKQPNKRAACWCQGPINQAVSGIPAGFFHPSAPIAGQHWPLGLPPILTGGKGSSPPARAMVVVTDGHYRILSAIVGIPDGKELTRLIEDAEETRRCLQQYHHDPDQFVSQMAHQCRSRVKRLWQIELDQQLAALGKTSEQRIADLIDDNERFSSEAQLRFGLVADHMQNAYVKSVQLRFGMSLPSDFARLVVLEQHSLTRLPWITCVLPFIAGADLRVLYLDLAETVWNRRAMPVQSGEEDALASWITKLDNQRPFALHVPLPLLRGHGQPQLAAVSDVARRRGLGWQDLDAALGDSPIRETSVRELATWLYRSRARPLDLQRPSQTRYLFFRSTTDNPFLIRDGEPPGRSITMIRQVQK